MHNADSGIATGDVDRFDQVEALLGRYPAISQDELNDLKHWFRKEASAFEVASLASKEAIHYGYAQFRREHIDVFSFRDVGKGLIAVAVLIAIVGGLWLLGV
ncbi:hypothetical protein D6858_08670 [Tsuneonella suprasediminis]|uniref:Uncharacterized protein n=1 Tax=Tsuneonella suprasediminis TaxID=2306996 RepID=A0A419R250_9SPHN|nr:hypothetical protein [Tsuneonella suprasediminis]RJX68001.1 hypothetical protein D6858_08670 [Tsuneonella suprasediminis]